MVSLDIKLFLPLQLLLTAVGKSVARRPFLKTQAELCFGMCQGDISLLFRCRCCQPCSLGREQGLSSVGMQLLLSAASSWISSVPGPCVCGTMLCSHSAAEPPHSDYQTSRGGKRSEKKTSLTCHYWALAAVCYPIVTNNLCNFVSNVFLASFKHNDWGVTFSSQLCKYGMFSWLSGAILHLAHAPCPWNPEIQNTQAGSSVTVCSAYQLGMQSTK